jgi:hypothetical protein
VNSFSVDTKIRFKTFVMMHCSNLFDGSLLDTGDSGSLPSLLHYSSEHRSSVTGLLNTSGSSSSVLVSSSLDGTCKVKKLCVSYSLYLYLQR